MEFALLKLNLILRRKSEDIMIFSPAPWFRILFLFLAGIVFFGIFTIASGGDDGSFIVPGLIALICVIAALYEESWTFDRAARIITSQNGLIIFHRTKAWSFDDVESIELQVFLRGAESDGSADHEINLTKAFSRENTEEAKGGPRIIHRRYQQDLRLNLKSGDRVSIESLAARNTEALAKKSRNHCGLLRFQAGKIKKTAEVLTLRRPCYSISDTLYSCRKQATWCLLP